VNPHRPTGCSAAKPGALRSVVRPAVRSFRAVADLLGHRGFDQLLHTIRTDSRIQSTPLPARNASRSSDIATDIRPSVGPFIESLPYTPKLPPMALTRPEPLRSPPKPTTQGDAYPHTGAARVGAPPKCHPLLVLMKAFMAG